MALAQFDRLVAGLDAIDPILQCASRVDQFEGCCFDRFVDTSCFVLSDCKPKPEIGILGRVGELLHELGADSMGRQAKRHQVNGNATHVHRLVVLKYPRAPRAHCGLQPR